MNLNEVEQNVMGELKDFQKATVERIDYLFRKGQNRVLVSDEVGLGKTLVARGTIAKFAKLRQEEGDDLVKVVYLCSNSTIAEQNLEKLRITDKINTESTDTSRLSMQHLNIFMQENDENYLNNFIQLIPLTPKTSFNISNSQGKKEERALMFVILLTISDLKPYRGKLSQLLSFDVNDWNWLVKDYIKKVKECNIKSNREYLKYMSKNVKNYLNCTIYNNKSLMECLKDFCLNQEKYSSKEIKDLVVQLRIMFSDISINRLDSDLIIMDEFQRFKDLLDGSNEDINKLSSKFFSLDDVRILMLSATPYKMFSTLDEIDEDGVDAHYFEFFKVMNFLNNDTKKQDIFRKIWTDYSIELKEFNKDNSSFILAKNKAENALYKNICRTERIAEDVGNLMESTEIKLNVSEEDIDSYIEAQKLITNLKLHINVPIDYIKSTPYIMSFMEDYTLKKELHNHFKEFPEEIYKMNKKTFWLNKENINNYDKISFNNARLNDLMSRVLDNEFEKLLWIPPSKPYYGPEGVFKNKDGLSKTLIFSTWLMVPKMISSLVSYEVERKTIGKLDKIKNDIRYFTENRYPSKRLDFSFKNEKPNKMTLFTLLYPSRFLVSLYDPIDCLNRNLSCEKIEYEIKEKLKDALPETPKGLSNHGDSRWYYLAPLMLDNKYPNHVENWFDEMNQFITKNYSKQENFPKYLDYFNDNYSFFKGNIFKNLGKQPTDLWDVLCDMVIASPAICAYRCYSYMKSNSKEPIGQLSTTFANIFRIRMNQPESISVIDLIFKESSEDAYWKNVLKYSKQGNLQAVFDEYVHMLSCNIDKNNKNKISMINNKIVDSLDFRTSHYNFDTYEDFSTRIYDKKTGYPKLRSHFAVSFIKGEDNESAIKRRKSVRNAFNSPFRPFVLTSTSIGQEGLDFHNYCRRIVHWNLPANPLELEQREGRINRFKCLAIRQNVAKKYGHINFKSNDIWHELFDNASNAEKTDGCSDLVPYWGLKFSPDMIKIERIVPMYPFSRDVTKYDRLMKILSLYRLTLGQSRQEELLSQIYKGIDDIDNIEKLFINLSPFFKKDIIDN